MRGFDGEAWFVLACESCWVIAHYISQYHIILFHITFRFNMLSLRGWASSISIRNTSARTQV